MSGIRGWGVGAGEEQIATRGRHFVEGHREGRRVIQNPKSKIVQLSLASREWEAKSDSVGGDGVAAISSRAQTGADNSQ